jgi:hypothetical protein
LDAAVTEVLDYVVTVLANGAEVEGIATGVKREDHIELLNENTAWLMDRTDDGLTSRC